MFVLSERLAAAVNAVSVTVFVNEAKECESAEVLVTAMTSGHTTAVDIIAGPRFQSEGDGDGIVSKVSKSACRYTVDYGRTALVSLGKQAKTDLCAAYAVLTRLTEADRHQLGITGSLGHVAIACSSDVGPPEVHPDILAEGVVRIASILVSIESTNPDLSSTRGSGESEIAAYIASWLFHRQITVEWLESTPGRPSVVGLAKGTGGGRSLMLNGHTDTVSIATYLDDPLSGQVRDGKLFGRGAIDMKAGLAAAMVATAHARQTNPRGDVLLAAVADEENLSLGTEEVIRAGYKADGAIVTEPTNEQPVGCHKGFVWLEINVHGVAAHGSNHAEGVDAILLAGHLLAALDEHGRNILQGPSCPSGLGTGSLHASLISGGEERSSYPAACQISLERRTVLGESPDFITAEIERVLSKVQQRGFDLKFDLRTTFHRPAFVLDREDPLAQVIESTLSASRKEPVCLSSAPFWTDCALLAASGTPSALLGPIGGGLHGRTEWASVDSIEKITDELCQLVSVFCA